MLKRITALLHYMHFGKAIENTFLGVPLRVGLLRGSLRSVLRTGSCVAALRIPHATCKSYSQLNLVKVNFNTFTKALFKSPNLVFLWCAVLCIWQNSNAQSHSITANNGFLNVHTQAGKHLMQVPVPLLSREFLLINRVENAPILLANRGAEHGEQKLVRFIVVKGHPDSVCMQVKNMVNGQPQPNWQTEATTPNTGASLQIDITNYINSNGAVASGAALALLYTNASTADSAISITTSRLVDGPDTMQINTSLLLLPQVPMQARQYDPRVGFYTPPAKDNDENNNKSRANMVWRWRMEPDAKDTADYNRGKLVQPKNQIVIYVDTALPKKWLPYFIKGINDWQPAFEKAGFKNAIIGKPAPTHQQDSTWHLMDASHSAIVYISQSEEKNAGGKPGAVDPRSGQILNTHILWYKEMATQLQEWCTIQAGVYDPQARKPVYNDEFLGQLIRQIVAHEVGHSLGLAHNLSASAAVPVDSLRNKTWLLRNGIAPSIMDYARYNYVAQPADGVGALTGLQIGAYDKWAIEWGYKWLGTSTPAMQWQYLNQLTTQKLQNPQLWFVGEESFSNADPRSQTEDIGNNAIEASKYGIKNLQKLMQVLPQWVPQTDTAYTLLKRIYPQIIGPMANGDAGGQYGYYIGHVLKAIAGRYRTPKVYNQDSVYYQYTPVPAKQQQQAVAFISQYLFTTPYWLAPATLQKAGHPALSIVADMQTNVLSLLLFKKLYEVDAQSARSNYSVEQFLAGVEEGIWHGLATGSQPTDSLSMRLQNKYVDLLCNQAPMPGSKVITATLINHLTLLKQQLHVAIDKTDNVHVKEHLQANEKKITAVLLRIQK